MIIPIYFAFINKIIVYEKYIGNMTPLKTKHQNSRLLYIPNNIFLLGFVKINELPIHVFVLMNVIV